MLINLEHHKTHLQVKLSVAPKSSQFVWGSSRYFSSSIEYSKSFLIRDDYKECPENSPIVLNDNSEINRPVKMRKPGAAHAARWMSQVIGCQKVYLQSEQFGI